MLQHACLGRSHRSHLGMQKLGEAIERTRELLQLPDDYLVGIVPASDTGAVEMALWSLLGTRGVDVLAWESFGADWVNDIVNELRIEDVRVFDAPYGRLPRLDHVDRNRDIVFLWNGTTSGVKVPDGAWIADERAGLTICDATSAVFSMNIPWSKLDVATFSWQKVLGGEAAHGMLILGPRAIERLETTPPPRPLPKIFRLTKKGKINMELFSGATINTPSMLCVEDYLDTLRWAEGIGGLPALIRRTDDNFGKLADWVHASSWIDFLADQPAYRSTTSVCLKIIDPWFTGRTGEEQQHTVKQLCQRLEEEGAAYDIGSYRDAPPGLRIWCGATVETEDIERLLPWLDWGFNQIKGTPT